MANIKSAKKRIKVIEKKTQRNRRVKAHLKEIIKGFDAAVAENHEQEARDYLALAEKKLSQAGAKGTIHKNAASRKISRLIKSFVKAFGTDALKLKANPPAIPTPEEKAARKAEKEAAKAAVDARKKGRRKEIATTVAEVEEAAPEEPVEDSINTEEAAPEATEVDAETADNATEASSEPEVDSDEAVTTGVEDSEEAGDEAKEE
jgi:small subunit ribosomal protein S20